MQLNRSFSYACIALVSLFATTAGARDNTLKIEIAPFKDALFANPKSLESRGDYTKYDYQEMRDINGRDAIPVSQVKAEYTEPLAAGQERRLLVNGVETYEAGDARTAKFAVIFIHGGGGNGSLGFSDITFGGNFNRLKHLTVDNGGVYESPSLSSFDDVSQIEKVLSRINKKARVVIACGSMGGLMCWSVFTQPTLAKRLAGVVLLGGYPHEFSDRDAGVIERVPVYLAHGSADPIYDFRFVSNEFAWLQQRRLPSKFSLYESGKHGTPIRMVNWRDVLSWMFAQP
jgi:pimeloyl-ACP methyl ester carboxylesterase